MVKRAILLALCSATVASAQKASTVDQTLIDLETSWVRAVAKHDVAALSALFAATYIDTDENGHRSDKAAVLEMLKSPDLKTDITLSDMHVRQYGNAAVVTGAALQKGTYKGQPLTGRVVFTDTFIRTNGEWHAVASQRSPVR